MSDPLEVRIHNLEIRVKNLEEKIKRIRPTKGGIQEIEEPVNSCTLCDGSGHRLTASGVEACECLPAWKEARRLYHQMTRQKPKTKITKT